MKVLMVQKRMGNVVPLVEPHRIFVMEGVLEKMCRKGPKDYVFVLFSDVLVYGVPTTTLASIAGADADLENPVTFKRKIDLASTSLSSKSDLSFQVSSPNKTFLVIAPDAVTKGAWYSALEECIGACVARSAETERGKTSTVMPTPGEGTSHAPLWVPDKEAPNARSKDVVSSSPC